MTFYSDMATAATRLVTQFGKSMLLRRTVGATINPVTGTRSGGTVTNLAVTGLFTKLTTKDIQRVASIGGSAQTVDRLNGSEVVIKLTAAVEPLRSDRVVDGADMYEIVDVDEANPAGTVIGYSLIARKVS